jgi:N-acetylmuramoyl-L-alanine amidase
MSQTPRRSGLARPVAISLALLLALEVVAAPAAASAATIGSTLAASSVSPAVFYPNGDGIRDRSTLTLKLKRTSKISVSVVDYRGTTIRRLWSGVTKAAGTHRVSWDGRTGTGGVAVNAGYRFRATISNGTDTFRLDKGVTKARSRVYPVNPGAIVVALDAGHGGSDPGAVRDGFTEASANLDITLRLRAMLQGAGVAVVTTRTADTEVNRSNVDLTGDGTVGYSDELASRVEVANKARADVFLCIHNNASTSSSAHGTETFYVDRSFSSENRLLAQHVQSSVVRNLRTIHRVGFVPLDRGVKRYDFYVLNGYSAIRRQRPSLMPGVLSEGLFVSNAGDRGVLRTASGRQTIAEGYYEALARYFEQRGSGARYELTGGPATPLQEGSAGTLSVKVTNTSPRAWSPGAATLTLSALPAVPWYDGSNNPGTLLRSIKLAGLAAGASTLVDVPFVAPAYGPLATRSGRALLKLDITLGGVRLANRGVVPLQHPLTILQAPAPVPTPTPEPSASPSPAPTPSASPSPAPEPSASPSRAPEPSASPSPPTTPPPDPSPGPNSTTDPPVLATATPAP